MPKSIVIPKTELYDEKTNRFITVKEQKIVMEHSLVSISKWEAKWNVPFLTDKPKTNEQLIDYIKCMTLTQNVNPLAYLCLTMDAVKEINEYINAPMTATWFSGNSKPSREIQTSETIYWQMIALNIPFECQKWHLNRLLTLIRVCNEKNQPPKKMSARDLAMSRAELNAKRKAALHSKG